MGSRPRTAIVPGVAGQDGAYLAICCSQRASKSTEPTAPTSSVNFSRIEEFGIADNRDLHLIEHDLTDLSASIRLLEKSSAKEVCDLADLADPYDFRAWRDRIAFYLDNPRALERREEKIRREYSEHTWDLTMLPSPSPPPSGVRRREPQPRRADIEDGAGPCRSACTFSAKKAPRPNRPGYRLRQAVAQEYTSASFGVLYKYRPHHRLLTGVERVSSRVVSLASPV